MWDKVLIIISATFFFGLDAVSDWCLAYPSCSGDVGMRNLGPHLLLQVNSLLWLIIQFCTCLWDSVSSSACSQILPNNPSLLSAAVWWLIQGWLGGW